MKFASWTGPACLAAIIGFLAAGAAPAEAAPKPITGKLSRAGHAVIALAANGESTSARTRRGRFRLRPPARRVSLHLRGRNGRYAGPIVVARMKKGRVAILGVRAGVSLGSVKVRDGYARVVKRLAERRIDVKRRARARKGVPIGAGNFGRVRSRRTRGGAPGDRDLDGIPNALDIDDDGDLTLDNVDRSPRIRARVAQTENVFNVRSVLAAPLWDTTNANATGLTDADIDTTLKTWGRLILEIMPGDAAELDCGGGPDPDNPDGWRGGLEYCTRGGTGTVVDQSAPPPGGPPFPGPAGGEYDSDGDGFGTLAAEPTAPGAAFFLSPGATTAQLGTGDVLIQHVLTGPSESDFTLLLPFIFATTPALVSYSDGQGNAATVGYPIADPIPGPNPGPGGPGTDDDPFPVKADPSGDVAVTLTFWRPQRRPIPPEPGEWTDIGKLTYSAARAQDSCPQGAFSEADPNLTPAETEVPYAPGAGGLRDQAADQPANPANTLTYTLNLTECLRGLSWNPGETRSFNFGAVDSAHGNVSVTETVTGVTFELQP